MTYGTALEQLRSRKPTHDPPRWEQAKHDAAWFVDKWGEKAAGFGWPAEEFFGFIRSHRRRATSIWGSIASCRAVRSMI